jgi:hypothetical protein
MSRHSPKRHRGVNRISLLAQYNESGFGCEANKGVIKPNVGIALLEAFFRIKNFRVVRINHVQCKHD